MDYLHGVCLAFTLGCTFYVLLKYFIWNYKCDTLRKKRIAGIAAFLCVLFLWWVQNTHRHKYSPEAQAMILFDKLLDDWQRGKKDLVISRIESLADSERPWHRSAVSEGTLEP